MNCRYSFFFVCLFVHPTHMCNNNNNNNLFCRLTTCSVIVVVFFAFSVSVLTNSTGNKNIICLSNLHFRVQNGMYIVYTIELRISLFLFSVNCLSHRLIQLFIVNFIFSFFRTETTSNCHHGKWQSIQSHVKNWSKIDENHRCESIDSLNYWFISK